MRRYLNVVFIFTFVLIISTLIILCKTLEQNNKDGFDFKFVKELVITGQEPFLTGYYPDIDFVNGKLYVSFMSGQAKHVMVMDEGLNLLEEAMELLPGPDHEIVYMNGYFYMAVSNAKYIDGDILILAKYDLNFNLVDQTYVLNADNQEETGDDHFLSVWEDKLLLVTQMPAYANDDNRYRTMLRIYDEDLTLIENHAVYPGMPGHIINKGDYWVAVGVPIQTTVQTDKGEKPFFEDGEYRLFAFFYDENFRLTHQKQMTNKDNFDDICQGFPYGLEQIGNHYFVSHISVNILGCKVKETGEFPGDNYVSIFDENFDFVKKIKISDHNKDSYSITFPRFCLSGKKLYVIYGLRPKHEERNYNLKIIIRVFERD